MLRASYDFAEVAAAEDQATEPKLTSITLNEIPERHPVQVFARAYHQQIDSHLLPRAEDLIRDPALADVFVWANLIEPIELDGAVDFKVVRQGQRLAQREGRAYRDSWMSDTVDPEFVRAVYTEVIAASVLRKPLYSRGTVPHRARSFLYILSGTFPVFADNQARLQLFKIEAQPYVLI